MSRGFAFSPSSWSIFAIVFCMVCASASDIFSLACSLSSRIFCRRAFSCCKRKAVLRCSEFFKRSDSLASKSCCKSNICSIVFRRLSASAVCFASYAAFISSGDTPLLLMSASFLSTSICCFLSSYSCSEPFLTACRRNEIVSF